MAESLVDPATCAALLLGFVWGHVGMETTTWNGSGIVIPCNTEH